MSEQEPDKPTVGDQAKQAGAQILTGAATSAVKGAAVGGAAGAAAGAVKGAAVSAAKNKTVQRLIILGVAAILVLTIAVCVGVINGAAALAASVMGAADQNTEYAIADDKVTADIIDTASSIGSRHNLPRELVISILQSNDDYDFVPMVGTLQSEDPQRRHRDLRAGSLVRSGEMARYIPEKGENADNAKAVRDLYVDAMSENGFSATQADSIYEKALRWALGNTVDADADACVTAPPVTGEKITINGSSYTAAQAQNMKIVIGIAKTMFPGDVRAAARIGLITVKQESGFQNYANDGILTPGRDPNPGGFTAEDYAHLAYSLELPHDAVGTDHASLGLLQQQATMGWGNWQTSTWAGGDYEAVITRLMTPAFTIGKFFSRLDGIDGWQDMEPGLVAQRIQVSAFPDAYRKHLPLADEIWSQYGGSTPAQAVPESTGWTGATIEDAEPGDSVCAGAPILIDGTYAWPIETREDGSPAGFLTSKYGARILNGAPNFHAGIDITGNGYGSNIYAITGGTVVKSNLWSPACGEYIQVAHADGTATGYLHMTDRLVNVGDIVQPGQLLAHMGGGQPGGCTFGAHLHLYAYDQQGNRVDPQKYLADRGLIFPADRDIAL